MKKKLVLAIAVVAVICLVGAGTVLIPNPAGKYILGEAKASGLIQYKPEEAYEMAKHICTQCHTDERIKKYCERCGPPFIAVVPHMQRFIDNYKVAKPTLKVENITEYQATAIVQVWNAIIGNWEKDFRQEDILKLIGGYPELKKLYLTPIDKRPIESVLMAKEDLKTGYMADMAKTMKKTDEPQPASDETHDHSQHMDHMEHMDHTHNQ